MVMAISLIAQSAFAAGAAADAPAGAAAGELHSAAQSAPVASSVQADRYGPSGAVVQKEEGARTGRGMEVVWVGGLNILVPAGMRVRKEGSQIIFEDIGEYLGRRLQSIEDRIRDLEDARQEMERKLLAIEHTVTDTRPLVSMDAEAQER